MRYVELLLEAGDVDAARRTLDDEGVDHVCTTTEDGETLLRFPLPNEAVSTVLERLQEDGVPEDAYKVVTAAEAITTPNFEQLQERFSHEEPGETVAIEELRTKALDVRLDVRPYALMTLCSAVIATIGLLRNSPLAVAGAMVISPFVGSVLSTAVGVLTGDRSLVRDAVRSQILGIGLAVAGAAALTWAFTGASVLPPSTNVAEIDQVARIISPTLPSLVLAFVAGAAGGLALATALPVILAGVAVAIALIPTAAAAGIGLAVDDPTVAIGAGTLLAMNVVALNIGVLATLRALGYGEGWTGRDWSIGARSVRGTARAVVLVVLVGVFVLGAAVPTYDQVRLERDVGQVVAGVVDEEAYRGLELVRLEFGYGGGPFVDAVTTVDVTVTRASDREYPGLAEELHARIVARTNERVAVRVRFEEYQPAGP